MNSSESCIARNLIFTGPKDVIILKYKTLCVAEIVARIRNTITHTQYAFSEEFLEGGHPEGRGHRKIILRMPINMVGQDSAVSIKPRYGLDGPGIESRWG